MKKYIYIWGVVILGIFLFIGYGVLSLWRDEPETDGTNQEQLGASEADPSDTQSVEKDELIDPLEVTYTRASIEEQGIELDYPETWISRKDLRDTIVFGDYAIEFEELEVIFSLIEKKGDTFPMLQIYTFNVDDNATTQDVLNLLKKSANQNGYEGETVYEKKVESTFGYEIIYTKEPEEMYAKEKIFLVNSQNNTKKAYVVLFRIENAEFQRYAGLAKYIFSTVRVKGVDQTNTEPTDETPQDIPEYQ